MKPDGTVEICPEGWRLYDAWTYALNTKMPAGQAKRQYVKHRATCPKCDQITVKKTDETIHE